MSEGERAEEPAAEPVPADTTEDAGPTLPEEPPETKLARRRSQHILIFSGVLFFLGIAGLEGLEIVKTREQNRRKRRDRALAAEIASAAASSSSRPPLPAWTPNHRP